MKGEASATVCLALGMGRGWQTWLPVALFPLCFAIDSSCASGHTEQRSLSYFSVHY